MTVACATMAVTVREALPHEYGTAETGHVRGYREFVAADSDWPQYLSMIADVTERAARTTILVAVDEQDRIVGSATLELTGRVEPDDDRGAGPRRSSHPHGGGWHPTTAVAASHAT